MARQRPYRNKPPSNYDELVQETLAATLFFVSDPGPTSFVLKDDNGKQYRINLGGYISCTCGGG